MSSAGPPFKTTLGIRPASRTDFIDVRARLAEEFGSEFARYPKALYVSHHTTAGYLDQRLAQRLDNDRTKLREYIRVFHEIFPPNAGYEHDELDRRTELSDEQKATEPENADSHLTFIGAGLQSAASYDNESGRPVWFVDLDGVHRGGTRNRRTTVVGYASEEIVARTQLSVEASPRAIDSIDLREPGAGFVDRLQDLVEEHGVSFGRLDVSLGPQETHASLTVNEFEPLLMKRDLRGALLSPLRFMADQGREILRTPLSLPGKALRLPGKALRLPGKALRLSGKALDVARMGTTVLRTSPGPVIDTATVEAVHIMNRVLERIGVDESVIARVLNRALALPVRRFQGLRREISLPVIDRDGDGNGEIPWGTYQSPILIQWKAPAETTRELDVKLVRFA
ncbi:hypothetical protein [Candidatus Palauibacter sp.]|uniref:hypothetical protein n=1 Tax=Candidatus Palauibacter sp. TaxID=3101350 RepID=UPI003B010130